MDIPQQPVPSFARNLTVADLPTVNYRALVNGDADEESKLLSVSVREGFFYLDLRNENEGDNENDPSPTLTRVDRIFRFMRTWFGQSDEMKLRDLQSNYTDGFVDFPADPVTSWQIRLIESQATRRPAFLQGRETARAMHTKAKSDSAGISSHVRPQRKVLMTDGASKGRSMRKGTAVYLQAAGTWSNIQQDYLSEDGHIRVPDGRFSRASRVDHDVIDDSGG